MPRWPHDKHREVGERHRPRQPPLKSAISWGGQVTVTLQVSAMRFDPQDGRRIDETEAWPQKPDVSEIPSPGPAAASLTCETYITDFGSED